MESLVLFLVVGFIAVGWMALRRIDGLQTRIATLERKTEFLLNRDKETVSEPTAQTVTVTPKPVADPVAARAPAPVKVAPDPSPWQPPRPPVKIPAKPKPALKPKLDLETLLGAKGSVWIGGLALLFGAVFLLRYTIEAGMLTPIMRISVALLMGLLALGLSEWMARRDLKTPVGKALAAKADIPAILAAVGVFTLFGAVYAAHALYGLLGTLAAFVLMAVIAVGAMGLSLRRGPWLAAIGLIGALTVPLLVASVTPSYLGVVAYVALITGAALWVARQQDWPWLRAAALVGATVWLTILLGDAWNELQFSIWALSVVGVSILTLADIIRGSDGAHRRQWLWIGWGGIAVLTALVMLGGDSVWWIAYALPYAYLLGLITTAIRVDADRFWLLLPLGGVLFTTLFVSNRLRYIASFEWPLLLALLALAAIFALAILSVANRLTSDRGAMGLTLVGGVIAIVMLGVSDIDLWPQFAVAGLFGVATLRQKRLSVVRGAIWATGILWLISTFGLYNYEMPDLSVVSGILSVGFVAMIGLVLMCRSGRDDTEIRLAPVLLAGAAGLAALVAVEDSATYIFTTPFLNELWLYFGLPAAICAVGAVLFRRRRVDLASQALLGGTIVFALLLIVLLIHHAMNGGNLTATPGFADYAVQLLVAFAVLFGASWLRGGLTDWPKAGREPWRFIVPTLALGVSGLSLLIFVVAQLFIFNPLINVDTVINGHPVFNSLLLGYLAPALLLGGAALRFSGLRPVWFVRALGALAGVSWLGWTTAQIRRFAQGEVIAMDRVPWGNGELYAVSAVWLLTGIGLLLAGMKTGRRDLRLASAGLITLTSLKVFLIDMSALDGAFRAVSFIGLGIVLIGIGRLYQTVLVKSSADPVDT